MIRATAVPILALSAILALAGPAAAQPSPHAKHSGREIKALSAEEIDRFLSGQGMGLALPAELNGYPGPKHVLELAAELDVSEDQRQAVQRVHDAMLEQAKELGRQIVEAERRLDALFAGAEATPEALRAALDHLATLQAALRYTHLRAHLETKALLTEAQVSRYTHLRGYVAEGKHHGSHHGHQ
jgi:Spy/CpxP family protein refolding chaperone